MTFVTCPLYKCERSFFYLHTKDDEKDFLEHLAKEHTLEDMHKYLLDVAIANAER
jgi:hypothetical protein